MKYENMIRDDLISELMALNRTIDERVEKKVKGLRQELSEQIKHLDSAFNDFANKEVEKIKEDLKRDSCNSYGRMFFGGNSKHYLDNVSYDVKYHLTQLLIALEKQK